MVRTYKPTGKPRGPKPRPKVLPPLDYLRECFEIVGGRLVWKARPLSHFQHCRDPEQIMAAFNDKLAGKVAGHTKNRNLVTLMRKHQRVDAIIAAMEQQT